MTDTSTEVVPATETGVTFPIEVVGLYWHFVDIVWIVIFTVVYLIPTGSPAGPH